MKQFEGNGVKPFLKINENFKMIVGGMVQTGGSPMMMGHGPSPAVPTQFIPSPGSSHSGLPSPGPRSNLAPSPMSVSIATPQNDPPGGEDQAYLVIQLHLLEKWLV